MGNLIIPPATQAKLDAHIPKGERHKAKMDIAISLIGCGNDPGDVHGLLRQTFTEASDKEIDGVIAYAVKANPEPPKGLTSQSNQSVQQWVPRPTAPPQPLKPKRTAIEQVDWWTNGARVTPGVMSAASPTPIPNDHDEACALAIGSLYQDTDMLNVVLQFIEESGKARPHGGGKTLERDAWVKWIQREGVPKSRAGAWVRLNPCAGVGSGRDGAVTDADVTDFRYLLLESDSIPIPMQLALFQRLKLPVAAIIMSGGGSAHAWIKMDSSSADVYSEHAKRILANLHPFGIDQANKNPSRLSRLPGAIREIGARDGGAQSLIFLNTTTAPVTDDVIKQFEESLEFPAIEEKPLLATARAALDRYADMMANAGKLGVPTGIPSLDSVSGGMKPGHTIVVAGTTGGGKSTLGMHMIGAALKANIGVLLFSLEMDREEIFDLIVASQCMIDRNKFNNGRFSDYDLTAMAGGMPSIGKLPLYIEDSALSSADQIRLRTLQLKAAGKIGLIVVDYIQFVNPGIVGRESREQQVAAISHTLRALARETKLPMVILSQLNDEGKLRESRVIAHNANIVMVVDVKGDTFEVAVVKGRGIPCGKYLLEFDRRHARLIATESDTTPY